MFVRCTGSATASGSGGGVRPVLDRQSDLYADHIFCATSGPVQGICGLLSGCTLDIDVSLVCQSNHLYADEQKLSGQCFAKLSEITMLVFKQSDLRRLLRNRIGLWPRYTSGRLSQTIRTSQVSNSI